MTERFYELIHELADMAEQQLDETYAHFFETESGEDICIEISRKTLEIKSENN